MDCCKFVHTGLLDLRFDTEIKMTQDSGSSQAEARRCGTKMRKEGSTIAKTLPTTEVVDCQEILEDARRIREARQGKEPPNVVSGNFCQLGTVPV